MATVVSIVCTFFIVKPPINSRNGAICFQTTYGCGVTESAFNVNCTFIVNASNTVNPEMFTSI